MAIGYWEFQNFCRGRTGSIYVARKGTVTVYEIGGKTYLINNLAAPCGVAENPVETYWARSVDWAGGFSDYAAAGMYPAENPRIRANPILGITEGQRVRLREIAGIWQKRKARQGEGKRI
jgi:hypothetical protein